MAKDALDNRESGMPCKGLLIGVGVILLAGWLADYFILSGRPETYENDAMHFKYGSIGSDNLRRGLPYRIWQVLPEMFPQYLPQGKPKTYEAFGLITDRKDSLDRPIGFSKRWHLGIGDFVGVNCAFCHVSTVRSAINGPANIVLGMPANTVNPEAFFRFLFQVVDDDDFNVDNVLNHIKEKGWLGHWQEFMHRYVLIPAFQKGVRGMKHRFEFLNRRPTPFGPGRVDTWAFYKVSPLQDWFWLLEKLPEGGHAYIEMDAGTLTGIADFPAIWREKVVGGALHWDGNNTELQERNITAALGAGVTPATLDLEAVKRISRWFESEKYQIEKYEKLRPASISSLSPDAVSKGAELFKTHCYECHAENGARITDIVGIHEIKTDRARLDTFTEALSEKLNTVYHLNAWRLQNYWKTNGYANLLLTGIWLRAPYLHNGSVPTLWHLLQEPLRRPTAFCRGNDLYDWAYVGFEWDSTRDDCHGFFKYDTTLPGNGNGGHIYGTTLPEQDKRALIEYLKTL